MGDRLKNLRQSTSDALEIIRQLGSPEVHASLEKIQRTTMEAKEIMESVRSPEMVKNIDNIRLTAESIENMSKRLETLVSELMRTRILERIAETLVTVREALASSENRNNMSELTAAIREAISSLTALIDELRLTVHESKKAGFLHDTGELVKETSDLYRTMKD
jgi:DNA-binding transcriptional regulator GbsR (MarR family)